MIATYRLQLHPAFGFADVEALLPYFRRLGVSHLYLSPITEARRGSQHGYDVIDHNAVSSELGGREAFERLAAAAHEAGLALVLDFVPNHSGVGPYNPYWQDVLAYGPASPYAPYFDVDWNPIKPELNGKILLPFLGRPYGEVLDDGELGLAYDDGRFYATYYDNRYALSPESYPAILDAALPAFERSAPYFDLKDLRDAYVRLAAAEREKAETLRPRLARLLERIDLANVLEQFPTDALHELLERQFWRLSYWKAAGHEINYRRFFDINELVALRMEDDHVFWDTHRLLGELLALDGVDGVRIDHVDGLFDPHGYLRHLHELGAGRVWVEKILAHGETLPDDWPVEGTTGYEFMNDATGVLLQADGELALDRIYARYVTAARSFDDDARESKRLVMDTSLSSELFRLSYELDRLSEADYHMRDFTLQALRDALADLVATFDRYRTYLPYDAERAREVVHEAVYRARQHNPVAEPTVYDFIGRVVLGDVRDDLKPAQRAWVGRFQQYTAPVAAKGVEDTAFYRYLRLVALNEVGGEPGRFGTSIHAFHAHARFRAHRYPRNLLATATHDHKRGEDTRMRLIVLAEVPDAWDAAVRALDAVAERHRADRGPSTADAYLFFQVLAALWHPPSSATDVQAYRAELPERLWPYMQKASRESKRHTSWIRPDEAYEEALEAFVRGMLDDPETATAIDEIARTLALLGYRNTLSQLTLKFTTPGVPDLYQGTELVDTSLVDPDNRRPVDYARRSELLDEAGGAEGRDAETLLGWVDALDERAKFFVTARLLRLRRERTALFDGDYLPLEVSGTAADRWIALARTTGDEAMVVAVPRHPASWGADGDATLALPEALPPGPWIDALTGEEVETGAGIDLHERRLPWTVLLTA